ncbi:MAG: hypothetical protein K9N09_12210 [Candidatus Cloacimonetes bacterium]|nr:hypothetical protein [Candidatus Cloacimonadota bacterium]MCF7869447.1 hypothetical protein [Candidatus Cloacimonadota bacterium]
MKSSKIKLIKVRSSICQIENNLSDLQVVQIGIVGSKKNERPSRSYKLELLVRRRMSDLAGRTNWNCWFEEE